eukprot:COSAG03_NODE_1445_length_4071_cov_82.462739_3_plen_102_part_00
MRAVATLVWLTADMGVPSWLHSEAWLCMRRLTGAVSARTWLHCTTGPRFGRLTREYFKVLTSESAKPRPCERAAARPAGDPRGHCRIRRKIRLRVDCAGRR